MTKVNYEPTPWITGNGSDIPLEKLPLSLVPRVDIMSAEPRNEATLKDLTEDEKIELHLGVQRALRRHGEQADGDPYDSAALGLHIFDRERDIDRAPARAIIQNEQTGPEETEEQGRRLSLPIVALTIVAIGGYLLQTQQPGGIGKFF